jgi:hypothetical protein
MMELAVSHPGHKRRGQDGAPRFVETRFVESQVSSSRPGAPSHPNDEDLSLGTPDDR